MHRKFNQKQFSFIYNYLFWIAVSITAFACDRLDQYTERDKHYVYDDDGVKHEILSNAIENQDSLQFEFISPGKNDALIVSNGLIDIKIKLGSAAFDAKWSLFYTKRMG